MSNRKSENLYTNSLSGQSKDEIICAFAYSLATASSVSPKKITRDELLRLWRKGDVTDNVPDKLIRKYMGRALMNDESFTRLTALLKEGTKDKHLLGGIASRVLMDLCVCLENSFSEDVDINRLEQLGIKALTESEPRSVNWDKVRRDWAPAVAYLRTFMNRDEYYNEISKMGVKLESGLYADLVDMVLLKDTEMLWYINRDFLPEDKVRLTRYTHSSDFFGICMKNAYKRLVYMQDVFLMTSGAQEFGSFRGYAISSLMDDSSGMKSGYDILISDEMESSVLSAEKPSDAVSMLQLEEAYFDFWIGKGMLKCSYEYARIGIDIFAVCRDASLSKKDAANIVKEAFMICEIIKAENISFTTKRDKEMVSEQICRLWVERSLEKELSHILMKKRDVSQNDGSAKSKKIMDDLRKRNEKLEKSLEKYKSKESEQKKVSSDSSKGLLSEIAYLKKKLKEKEKELKEKDDDINELKELFLAEEDGVEEVAEPAGISEEEFREYIQSHKVLVWGLREETESKFRKLYPELSFMSSERRLTKQQIDAHETLLIATNYTSHSAFFAARELAKKAGIKSAYLPKTANAPETLHKALEIAAFGGAKNRR